MDYVDFPARRNAALNNIKSSKLEHPFSNKNGAFRMYNKEVIKSSENGKVKVNPVSFPGFSTE